MYAKYTTSRQKGGANAPPLPPLNLPLDLFTYNTVFVGNQTLNVSLYLLGSFLVNFVFAFYINHLAHRVFWIVCFLHYLTCMYLYFQTFFIVKGLTLMFPTQVTLITHSCLLLLLVFHCIRLLKILTLMEIIPSLT